MGFDRPPSFLSALSIFTTCHLKKPFLLAPKLPFSSPQASFPRCIQLQMWWQDEEEEEEEIRPDPAFRENEVALQPQPPKRG